MYCEGCGYITVRIHNTYKALLSITTHNSGNINSQLMTLWNILSDTMQETGKCYVVLDDVNVG